MKKIEYAIIKPSNYLVYSEGIGIIFICLYEMYKTINKITYFTYHLGRCKKTKDIIKLSAILAGLMFYTCSVMRIIIETTLELRNNKNIFID